MKHGERMKKLELLRAVRAKIEQGWTQRAAARNADGGPVSGNSQDAVCWCMIGAAQAIAPNSDLQRGAIYTAIYDANKENRPLQLGISDFNDARGRTKEQVLAVIDRAIEACQ